MRHLTLTLCALLTLAMTACAPEDATDDLAAAPSTITLGDLSDYATDALHTRDAARLDALRPTLDLTVPARLLPADAQLDLPRCAQDGAPALQHIVVTRADQTSAFHVELSGMSCGASIGSFDFRVFNAEGHDITSRSWPEVDQIEQRADGTFTLRGLAASCGDFTRATRVVLSLHGSNSMEATVNPL